jgi:hypothetical protein
MTSCSLRSEFHFCQGEPRRKDGSIELRKSSRDYLLKARAERLILVSGCCCLERKQGSEVSLLVIQGVGLFACNGISPEIKKRCLRWSRESDAERDPHAVETPDGDDAHPGFGNARRRALTPAD